MGFLIARKCYYSSDGASYFIFCKPLKQRSYCSTIYGISCERWPGPFFLAFFWLLAVAVVAVRRLSGRRRLILVLKVRSTTS
jgi:hypothetical protein